MRSRVLALALCAVFLCAGLPTPARAQISFDGGGAGGGAIVAGESTATCNSTIDGAIRYNSTNKCMDFCDGSAWRSFNCSFCPIYGIVGHWKLDESSGTTAADSSGKGNNGTLINSPAWQLTGGKIGGALNFNTGDDYVTVPDHNSLDFGTQDFSLSLWLKTSDTSQQLTLISKGNTQSSSNPEYFWLIISNQTLSMVTETNQANTDVTATTAVTNNAWHHAVFVRQGTFHGIYLDGVLDGSTTGTVRNVTNTNPLLVGCQFHGSTTCPTGVLEADYRGDIDDVRLYNRALSPEEIAGLYSGGARCQ